MNWSIECFVLKRNEVKDGFWSENWGLEWGWSELWSGENGGILTEEDVNRTFLFSGILGFELSLRRVFPVVFGRKTLVPWSFPVGERKEIFGVTAVCFCDMG